MKHFNNDPRRRSILRRLRDTWIKPLTDQHPHSVLISRATYSPWYADQDFMQAYNAIQEHTLVDIYRCYELWTLVKQTERVPGDLLEVGVWKGGTGGLMARQLRAQDSTKTLHLCDTFTGVVKAGEKDTLYRGGEHSDTSTQAVMQLMDALQVTGHVSLLQGIFPDDTGPVVEHQTFALCHIDVDTYQSAKDIFHWVSPRLSLHGVIVFDDYGTWGCEGVADLVAEIAKDPSFFLFQNINGHAVFVKLAEHLHD